MKVKMGGKEIKMADASYTYSLAPADKESIMAQDNREGRRLRRKMDVDRKKIDRQKRDARDFMRELEKA